MGRGRRIRVVFLAAITAGAVMTNLAPHTTSLPARTSLLAGNFYPVTSFFDGDTIQVDMNGSVETVRMIGVDTPETHHPKKPVQCYGEAASAFTKKLIGSQKVRLEADPGNTNRDRYGRLLRYVYLPDGRMVNETLIKQGYGFAYVGFPFGRMESFKADQAEAERTVKGLWGSCPVTRDDSGQSRSQ